MLILRLSLFFQCMNIECCKIHWRTVFMFYIGNFKSRNLLQIKVLNLDILIKEEWRQIFTSLNWSTLKVRNYFSKIWILGFHFILLKVWNYISKIWILGFHFIHLGNLVVRVWLMVLLLSLWELVWLIISLSGFEIRHSL